jgi:hypothetical protein
MIGRDTIDLDMACAPSRSFGRHFWETNLAEGSWSHSI